MLSFSSVFGGGVRAGGSAGQSIIQPGQERRQNTRSANRAGETRGRPGVTPTRGGRNATSSGTRGAVAAAQQARRQATR